MKVEHHTKYLEIHGVDETKLISMSEHKKLHIRLRKEGKCNIPPEELRKISRNANSRTEKHKKYMEEYRKENIERIHFTETMMPNVRLHETLFYNYKTGNVYWNACFNAYNGKKLYEVLI